MKKCPYCAEEIQDEAILCRYCGREIPADIHPENHKKCPYCSEWIRNEAKVCRYCNRDLTRHDISIPDSLREPIVDKSKVNRRKSAPIKPSVWREGLKFGIIFSILTIIPSFVDYIQGRESSADFEFTLFFSVPILFVAYTLIGTTVVWSWRKLRKRASKSVVIMIMSLGVVLIAVIIIGFPYIRDFLSTNVSQFLPIAISKPTQRNVIQTTPIPTKTQVVSVAERKNFLSLCESFKGLHNEIENFNDEWNIRMPELEGTNDVNKMYNTTFFFLEWWAEIKKSSYELPQTDTSTEFLTLLDKALDHRYKAISALADHYYSGDKTYHDQFLALSEVANDEYRLTLEAIWYLAFKYGYNPSECR